MHTNRLHVMLVVIIYFITLLIFSSYSLSFFCHKESLCGQRGLLPNTDVQTFQVSLTNRLRSQYDRIREPLKVCSRLCYVICYHKHSVILMSILNITFSPILQRNMPSRLNDPSMANAFEQNIRVYYTMNHFLGSIIDHVSSNAHVSQ